MSAAFLTEKLEFDTRERSGTLAKPRDPGEAGGTGLLAPVAPCGSPGFVLALVSTLSFPHLCRSSLVFPPVSRCSHGLTCPPLGPHPEPGSAFSLSHTARGCVRIRTTPDRLSLLILGKCKEMRIQTAFFLVFLLCPGIGVTLSVFTDCLRPRSDAGL